MVSAGLGENIASVDVFSGRAQGVFKFGCKEGTVPHGDEDVVVAAHEAYGAQQGGHGDEFGAVAPVAVPMARWIGPVPWLAARFSERAMIARARSSARPRAMVRG